MSEQSGRTILWILRIGVAMCFVGHGMFGIITKADWLPFFALVGIGPDMAYRLMPAIGTLDIAIGLSVLLRPVRAVLGYMVLWTVWTAALRPITGLSVFELLERAGNYGVPLALLLALAGTTLREWFVPAHAGGVLSNDRLVFRVLSVTTAMLLIGHGGLAIEGKPLLLAHGALLGADARTVAFQGVFELVLAAAILAAPVPGLLLLACGWKVATELLFPISGAPAWEFVERGGSYAAPLAAAAIALARRTSSTRELTSPRPIGVAPAVMLLALLTVPSLARAQSRAAQRESVPVAPTGIFDSLRLGGYVIACRHAITDHNESDRGPTRGEQRNINQAGIDQARAIGASVQALRIPIGEVRANPMYRSQETARFAFGSMTIDSSLGGRGASDALRAMLKTPVPRSTNRAIVARTGILSGAFEGHGVREINEGDCFVVRPTVDDFRVLARIAASDWPKP